MPTRNTDPAILRGVLPIAAPLWLPIAPPLCWHCGGPATPGPLCRRCRAGLRWLGPVPVSLARVEVWAPLAYEGAARALVHGLKFARSEALADAMASQIVASAPHGLLTGTLVPVPLPRARRLWRGFNQAESLAAALATRSGLPLVHCLERRGPPARQVGRGRRDRLRTPSGSVSLRGSAVAPPEALLVDDVATTGATLAACAAALRAAGTRRVAAVAYARTPPR